jgi:hypothetical protein
MAAQSPIANSDFVVIFVLWLLFVHLLFEML